MSGLGGLHIGVRIVARNPCSEHGFTHTDTDTCQKGFIGETFKDPDMGLYAFAAALIANVFDTNNTATSVPDTGGTSRSWAANSATSSINIRAGSGTTTPTFGDHVIQTPLTNSPAGTGLISATTGTAITNNTTNGTFVITGTFTNGTVGNLTYAEIGIEATANTFIFLLSHDLTNGATGYIVSPSGTVAVTYTVTIS
jgi:hypothetical protein